MQYLTQHAEWVKVPFPETISRVICRTSNRIFVGVPLCPQSFSGSTPLASFIHIFFSGRDRDYQNLNLAFAVHFIKIIRIISWFPEFLKPCVVPLYTSFFYQ
jgi:hypothetical protein